jgi:hypothetical protein
MIGDVRPFVEEMSLLKHGLPHADQTWSMLDKFAQGVQ